MKKYPVNEKAGSLNEKAGFEIVNPEQQGRYVDNRLFRNASFMRQQQRYKLRPVLLSCNLS